VARAGTANRSSRSGEGEGEVDLRSPNIWPGRLSHRRREFPRRRPNFIAFMKRHPMSSSLSSSRARSPRLILAALGLAVAARAQSGPVQLAPIVVVASRLPESAANSGSAVDVISGADLSREQLTTFADALAGVPGAPAFATGQLGAATSLFLRGSDSNQTLFLVDGIRLNDANTDYGNFLGGARIFPADTIEIARGPQSTLYGSEAVGGVVSLRMNPGVGTPSESITAEAGSFHTTDGVVTAQGAQGAWAYNVALAGEQTANDRPDNDFDSINAALRLDDKVLDNLTVGATLRGLVERYDDPGAEFAGDAFDFEREDNWLGTLFADTRLTDLISSHLIIGGQDRRFVTVVPAPGEPSAITLVKNERGVIDWQLTGQVTEHNRLTVGTTTETDSTFDNGFGAINKHQGQSSLFANDEWSPLPDLHLTGGLRHDDYDTFGDATTGRATLAWLSTDGTLKLRGSYGTGFDAPSFLDLYGQNAFFVGNPALRPERSRGWDGGLDYYGADRVTTWSATWFQTDYSNLIVDNFNVFPATTANVESARTRGVELSVKTALLRVLNAKAAYTYLEAVNLSERIPLLRRPRNSLSGDLWADLGHGVSLGAGGTYVGRRPDVDAVTFATIEDPSYSTVRIYAACQLTRSLAVKVRVENALNRPYAPVNGYPEPARGIFGSAEFRF
jgi:vitamin B12 transporter